MKSPQTWYVVMNSNRARILRDLPKPHEALPVEITLQGRRRKMADVNQDRPTRSFASAGGGRRFAVEPGSEPQEEDARNFLREVQDFLSQEAEAGAFERLVIIAPADTIGLWRALVKDRLQDHVIREIGRNLVSFSAPELVAAVRALVND